MHSEPEAWKLQSTATECDFSEQKDQRTLAMCTTAPAGAPRQALVQESGEPGVSRHGHSETRLPHPGACPRPPTPSFKSRVRGPPPNSLLSTYCPPEGSKASGGGWRAVPHLPQPGGQAQSQGSGPLCLSFSPLSRLGPVSPTSRTLPALVSRRRPPGLIPWCAPFCSGKPPRSSREFPGEPMAF